MPDKSNENSNESKPNEPKKVLTPEDIKLPDSGEGTEATIHGDLIFFVTIDYDTCADDPTGWDATGKMHSFSRKHCNFLKNFDFPASKDECREEIIKKFGDDVVFLGYYEHGQCSWFVEGCGGPGTECRWDGVQFAGFWEPDAELKKMARYNLKLKKGTPEREKKMVEWAKQACKVYTEWCNGEVYGYNVAVYKIRREGEDTYEQRDDYRFAEALEEESCSGYYGDDIKECVNEAVKSMLTSLVKKGILCESDIKL
jgi:hypothetical protein